jgi:hypothetical protein
METKDKKNNEITEINELIFFDMYGIYEGASEDEKKFWRSKAYDAMLNKLEECDDEKIFYYDISILIRHVFDFNQNQLNKLVQLVRYPFKSKKGAKNKKSRNNQILFYWSMRKANGKKVTRKMIIEHIIENYRITPDAATKIYNQIKPKLKN